MNDINNKYAPGVATYGAPGAQGNRGKDGYGIFYVPSYDINDESVKDSIIKNKYISNNSNGLIFSKELDRQYQINDLFLTRSGKLYKLVAFDVDNSPEFECVNENFLPGDTSILNYFDGTIYNKVGRHVTFIDSTSISNDANVNVDAFSDGVMNIVSTNDGANLLSLYNYDKQKETSHVLNVHASDNCFIFDTTSNICIENLKSRSDIKDNVVTVNDKTYYSPITCNDNILCDYSISGNEIKINNYTNEFITVYVFNGDNSYINTIVAKSSTIDVSKYGDCNFIVAANNGNYISKILEQKIN